MNDRQASAPAKDRFFESIPGCCLILDPELRIIAVTDSYLDATGSERTELAGRELLDVLPNEPYAASTRSMQDLTNSLERVTRTLRPDSMSVLECHTHYWRPVNTPVIASDGTLSHIVHQLEDATEVERLHDVNAQLRAASEEKNAFLGRMSHELRSPLTAVIGYSELLMLDAPLGHEDMKAAEAIFRAGEHLQNLSTDVQDLTRIESGHMPLSIEPVSLEEVLVSAVELMAPFASNSGIKIENPGRSGELHVKADRQRLTQVVVNLLSNAIKYNRPGGRVSIAVTRLPLSGRARLAIVDTGMGIDEGDFTKLFEPFERLGAEVSGVEGTGLGLSLSRSLVEEMGGAIDVQSELGIGSTFSVELTTVETRRTSGS